MTLAPLRGDHAPLSAAANERICSTHRAAVLDTARAVLAPRRRHGLLRDARHEHLSQDPMAGSGLTLAAPLSESAWNGGKDGGEYRRVLKQALDDAHAGKFQVIVVWALDRINREGAEGALRLIRQFKHRGCILVSVADDPG